MTAQGLSAPWYIAQCFMHVSYFGVLIIKKMHTRELRFKKVSLLLHHIEDILKILWDTECFLCLVARQTIWVPSSVIWSLDLCKGVSRSTTTNFVPSKCENVNRMKKEMMLL